MPACEQMAEAARRQMRHRGRLRGVVADPLIARLVEASPLAVNIMVMTGSAEPGPPGELGVARISHVPGPWRGAMQWLADAARATMA
ncbi:isocitrate lyase/phosphoenolpyruvate mutase family protein [Frateuria soli]|uniref:isocitrate lyase/phosphoenolpyruvate mutase family protein n=1 Tax=Frateuria soli TaxID=1542730 RepID=UPI001E5B019D|nr:isocitrate lyase/phosphoenolpyruvate mutase family protein [Frateuria soli]UGB38732.1 isocitrate lyase/phosphoenolpyruvate mutase family protein [Frateuria soli]